MKAVVWSKYHCPFCDQAKALLTAKGIEFIEKKIGDGFTKEELQDIIHKNTFVNLRAKMEFVNWKKV